MSEEDKVKTQEMIYVIFTDVPQSDIDEQRFGNWLESTATKLREDFKTKKVFIHVFGKVTYLISQKVVSDDIDRVGFSRWFGMRRRELGEYFDVDWTRDVFIKAV